MVKQLEVTLNELATQLREIFNKGKCTEKIKEYLMNGERVLKCKKCKTLNAYYLSPSYIKCDNCDAFYQEKKV